MCHNPQAVLRKQVINRTFISTIIFVSFISGCSTFGPVTQTGCRKRENLDPKIEAAIDGFRASVPDKMSKGKIPGVAIALVDNDGIIWAEGFGYTDLKRKIPATPDTPFHIGSISKTFTATAVLLAVQDGLLNLDESITMYLPNFKVYSRYEEHPEQKITLRRLLSHTAGIPHETVGCNMLEITDSFEDRVRSLYETWLKCPVGQGYSYSGAGYDVAAYVLQKVSGIPFEQYIKERILDPLGMANSTLNQKDIRNNTNRAIGHTIGIAEHPSAHGLLGAGGVFTSAADLARFAQLLMNEGIYEGKCLLDESLIDVMLTPNAVVNTPEDEIQLSYGMGIVFSRLRLGKEEIDTRGHTGAGGGYFTHFEWYPEYGTGTVVLTNRVPHSALYDLAIGRRLLEKGLVAKSTPVSSWDCAHCVPKWTAWPKHNPSPYKPQWKKYCGKFMLRLSGYKLKWWAKLALFLDLDQYTPRIKVFEKDGYLYLTESKLMASITHDWQVEQKLQETKPGLFFTASGSTLDFRGEIPTWRNYRLRKR
ncbi:MAG: hypothetical protein AMJ75_10385 [Phycisphaerae bacterium SM1_79]|nr:MAG: hypothetical protein AMJ75_10385 [Phycisphaerae bacterium SM1_79]